MRETTHTTIVTAHDAMHTAYEHLVAWTDCMEEECSRCGEPLPLHVGEPPIGFDRETVYVWSPLCGCGEPLPISCAVEAVDTADLDQVPAEVLAEVLARVEG